MKTNDEFLKEVHDLVGDEYTFLEEYKGARVPIKYRHNPCGNIYKEKTKSLFDKWWNMSRMFMVVEGYNN